jgi:hypothetical protein
MSDFTGWRKEPDSCLYLLTHSGVPLIDRYGKRKANNVSREVRL